MAPIKKITLFQLTAIEGGHLDQQVFVCRLTCHAAGLRKETNKKKEDMDTLEAIQKLRSQKRRNDVYTFLPVA